MLKKKYADGSAPYDLDQTRPMLMRVAQAIGQRVGNTLGPGGRQYMTPLGITNDGASIIQEIRFEDEREDSLADAFEECARRQDLDAGDGTTTATTLLCKGVPILLQDVLPIEVPMGKSVMAIKKQLEDECVQAIKLLEEEKNANVTEEELIKVAKTAMENHSSSELIAKTVFELGFNANTPLEEGFSGEVTTKVVPGIHMPLKIEASAMFTNATRKETSYPNGAIVLVANHIFENYSDLSRFFAEMIESKEKAIPIVIIAKKFSVPFTAQVVAVSRSIKLPMLLLNAEGLKDEEMQDIAEFVNGRYIDTHPKGGEQASAISFKDAGYTNQLIAGPQQTSFTGGQGIETGRVSTRTTELQKLAETEQNDIVRDELRRRAAGLQGGVATFYVDAKTSVEKYYLKKKVEDAVNSCKSALQYGTLAGGGLAYKRVAEKMDKDSYLARILPVIYERIQQNAGGHLSIDAAQVRDAFHTDKCALQNAVSILSLLVTLEGVIADHDRSLVDDLAHKLQLQ